MLKLSHSNCTDRKSAVLGWSVMAFIVVLWSAPLTADDVAEFCQDADSRTPLAIENLQRLEARYPEEEQYLNPMPMEGDKVWVWIEPSDSRRERRRNPGGVLVVCAVRSSDHPQGAGTEVKAIIALPEGRDFGHPHLYRLDGFHQAGMMIHMFPAPYERSTRRRLASRIASGAAVAGVTVFTGGTAVAAGAVAAEQLISSSSGGDDEESEHPLVVRARIDPRPGTAPEPEEDEVATKVQPQYPADPEPEPEVMTETITVEWEADDGEQEMDPRLRRGQERLREGLPAVVGSPVQPAPTDLEEDCVSFNPDAIAAREVQGSWRVVDGSHWVMSFDDARDEAERALAIIQHHGFDQLCFVGRPDPSMTYLLRGGSAAVAGAAIGAQAWETASGPIEDVLPTEPVTVETTLEPAANRILWTFEDDNTQPASTPAGVRVSSIRDPNGLRRFEVTDSYDYVNSPIFRFAPPTGVSGVDEAFEVDGYVEFDISPTQGPVTLSHIIVSMARGSTRGDARGLHLRWSQDDYGRILWQDDTTVTRPDIARHWATLEAVTIAQPTTFRLYANAPGSRRTVEIGDLAFDVD